VSQLLLLLQLLMHLYCTELHVANLRYVPWLYCGLCLYAYPSVIFYPIRYNDWQDSQHADQLPSTRHMPWERI